MKKDVRMLLSEETSFTVFYDREINKFTYPDVMIYLLGDNLLNRPVWDFLKENGIISCTDAKEIQAICHELNDKQNTFFKEYRLTDKGIYRLGFIYNNGIVSIIFTNVGNIPASDSFMDCDELTGLLNRTAYCDRIQDRLAQERNNKYAIYYFDIIKFKAINDIFGFKEGDRLLKYLAKEISSLHKNVFAACRLASDQFSFIANVTDLDSNFLINKLLDKIASYDLPFQINANIGIFLIDDNDDYGDAMLDKAILAQSVIKGSFTKKYNYYTDRLRYEMISEQEIVGTMANALEERQFVVFYQPQYNHSTGMLIGAEAVVRWRHPDNGLISPGVFIPIFEKNGFITKLDLYVFEEVCRFQRKAIDNNYSMVPISINFSKNDIYSYNFVEELNKIRNKYDVPSKFLRIEITESVLVGDIKFVNDILNKLHEFGYVIEMDDFGSGYSSLNVLKDIEFDIIKLDMLFLSGRDDKNRGGTILSSVINMAKWLKIPVIAEGVENVSQADFLRSVGCDYIQGYLYSKPISEDDYEKIISKASVGEAIPQMKLIDTLNAHDFWNPTSQETLIFSNYVGGAAIFSYDRKKIEMLRVNKKYLQELGMNNTEKDIIQKSCLDELDDVNKMIYFNTLDLAIETLDEQECDTWRTIKSECCGVEHICIRSTVRLIGRSESNFLFYVMIKNITAEKQYQNALLENERRFKAASEQVNIYYWEYTVATHEMKPCFRCMRDLGLPPLLRNYPDSAIEAGIFPPEVADMYRDWHVQIANGVKELEAVIPLTANRVPFRVRYTTEFDENGNPIKAYGSAALVVE